VRVQPGSGEAHLPCDGPEPDAHRFSYFALRESAEVSELYYAALFRIKPLEFRECVIQREYVLCELRTANSSLAELDLDVWPCSFRDPSGSGMIHQYPSHDVGSNSDEMSATRPCPFTLGPQTQICFMQ
jgi:hypothetical protein